MLINSFSFSASETIRFKEFSRNGLLMVGLKISKVSKYKVCPSRIYIAMFSLFRKNNEENAIHMIFFLKYKKSLPSKNKQNRRTL